MPLISASCIEKIRQQVSIADVVAPYTQLKPCGRYLKGLSPFTHEKTPSFFVDVQKNIFKCYSSGHAGDMFRFLELKEQLSFSESIEWICEKFSIPLEYENTSNNRIKSGTSASAALKKKTLLQLYARAHQLFQQRFWMNDPLAHRVQDFWQNERHFKLETARLFEIGFASTHPTELFNTLRKEGATYEDLVQSGLFYQPKQPQNALVSRFQGRLIIPIHDIQGRVIAFSGRHLPFISNPDDPTQESKYVNSPETPLFVKGHTVFNLNRARQANQPNQPFFLVEGPMDVIRCWECGLKTAVAPQGTGLTEEQLKLLKRYDTPIVGLFDGDTAGIKAGIRLMTLGIPLEIPIHYYRLASTEDPDSALLEQPALAQAIVPEALTPIQFFQSIAREYTPNRVQQQVLKHLLPIIARCTSPVLRFDLLNELSGTLGIPQRILEAELRQLQATPTAKDPTAPVDSKPNIATLEGQILRALFQAPRWTPQLLEQLPLDWLDTTHPTGQLLVKVLSEFQANGISSLQDRSRWQLTPEEVELWSDALAAPYLDTEDVLETLNFVLQQLHRRFLKKSLYKIDKMLSDAVNLNEHSIKKLQADRNACKQELSKVASHIYIQ